MWDDFKALYTVATAYFSQGSLWLIDDNQT